MIFKRILSLKKWVSIFLILLILIHSTGCHYFKIRNVSSDDWISLHNIGTIHKYFILHTGDLLYSIESIELDSLHISGEISPVNKEIFYSQDHKYRYRPYEKNILQEVHIYLDENISGLRNGYNILPLSDIKEIRIIEKDTGKTTASYIGITLLVILGVFIIITIIALLTKSSCPYIYVYDGESFVFEGEIYGGSIARNLERDDYMPLPSLKALNNTYRIRISNELLERQYTDLAELIVINHPEDQNILLDRTGAPQPLTKMEAPIRALSSDHEDILASLKNIDKNVYLFNEPATLKPGALITFDKPMEKKTGKLVLSAKNTLWIDYVFGKFLEKFGSSYNTWMDHQNQLSDSERIQRMIDNDFPLSVYLKKNSEWELVEYLFTPGPLAYRNYVIPMDLSEIPGDELEIKIETGFMFWELDYAAIDFSADSDVEVSILKPVYATGSGSVNWTSSLMAADGIYMVQENAGEVTELVFNVPPLEKGRRQTLFLHSRGYYELIRDFKGMPQLTELNKFKVPGYFSEFSWNLYSSLLDPGTELAGINSPE